MRPGSAAAIVGQFFAPRSRTMRLSVSSSSGVHTTFAFEVGLLTVVRFRGAAFDLEGPVTWGLLLAFNCIGAFDYAHGLLAQYMHPQIIMVGGAPAKPPAIYGSIGLGLLFQLINIVLLLTPDVVKFFTADYDVNNSGECGPNATVTTIN